MFTFSMLHKIKSLLHHFSASFPSDQSTWSVELSTRLPFLKTNRNLIPPVVPIRREWLFMPTSVQHAKSMTSIIVSSCFWVSITILALNQAYEL